MSATASTVNVEFRDQVAFLALARPDSANTMNLEFGKDFLSAAISAKCSRARAIVLCGEGKNFCFGGDLRGMIASGADVKGYLGELTKNLHEGMALLAAHEAPVIVAVNGTAAGAGLGLVLMADLAIGARSARFTAAYTGVGLTPDAGCTFLLPRTIGTRRAMEMLLTNRTLDAAEALEWGLINKVVEDDELAASAARLAERLAQGPRHAYGRVKRLMKHSQPGYVEQMDLESLEISAQAASSEGVEGISAFLEKRSPRF
jgi:2-(1,2-epoxy-1,2-dihydrophenyl)acetyl-CoA isomerase